VLCRCVLTRCYNLLFTLIAFRVYICGSIIFMAYKIPLYSNNLSWLSFNYRVLQEAMDKNVPLLERLKFLAIYSSNLDEFFRVKVAAIRSLSEDKSSKKLDFDPDELLENIIKEVGRQQNEFGRTFREEIIPGLNDKGIFLLSEQELKAKHKDYIQKLFDTEIEPLLKVFKLTFYTKPVFLENRKNYLVFKGKKDPAKNSLVVEIPSVEVGRFIELPTEGNIKEICFLDDIIRICFPKLHSKEIESTGYAVKLSRDAELNIEDEFSGSLIRKIQRSLKGRLDGAPARFLYDDRMPKAFLSELKKVWNLKDNDCVAGAQYHNFSDFFEFVLLVSRQDLQYPSLPKVPVHWLEGEKSYFKVLNETDVLLHYPYHSYDYFIKFLELAVANESVTEIKITLYRVASDSKVCKALIAAAKAGKKVTAFFEVKARFDEASNIYWSEELKKAGCNVLYSFPGLKVHAKLCLITKRKGTQTKRYAYLSTGNFNENTANVYTDFGLLTSDRTLTSETEQVFSILCDMRKRYEFKHLLLAPDRLRSDIYQLIDKEIIHHLQGKESGVVLKMNGLDDPDMIEKLYEASRAGVPVRIINRGICRLLPGINGLSENIYITSIVDRFLEHHRLYWFKNAGDDKLYLSSADFMNRNLSRRIEVAYPINEPRYKKRLIDFMTLYMSDNTKSRIIDKAHKNEFVKPKRGQEKLNAQTKVWEYYMARYEHPELYEDEL
jgi:polyphosphate kinase